jgi:hypothetical protein
LRYEAAWFPRDLMAGLVLTTMLVPVGIACAVASGVPGINGLYAMIVPLLAYAPFGPSRILVLGPDSSLAPVILVVALPLSAGALWHPDWSHESRALAMHAYEATGEMPDHAYVIANAHWEPHDFALPAVVGRRWHLAVDTMQEPPADIAEPGAELRLPESERIADGPRSVVVLVAR